MTVRRWLRRAPGEGRKDGGAVDAVAGSGRVFGKMADEMHNEPELSTAALTDEEKSARLAQLTEIIEMVRPIIQQDGGDLLLLSADVETGVVELQLQGACSSCAVSSTTLQAGVERILKDRLDWVTEISGGVDGAVRGSHLRPAHGRRDNLRLYVEPFEPCDLYAGGTAGPGGHRSHRDRGPGTAQH